MCLLALCLLVLPSTDPAKSVQIPTSPGPYAGGQEVTLSCIVTDGNPTPGVTWYRDDAFAENGADYTFSASGADHGKKYRCDANNAAGTVSDEITLITERK